MTSFGVTVKNIADCELKVTEISEGTVKQKDELQKTITEDYCYHHFVVLQAVVSSGEYSGYNTPPMYGDFEAQRHWMEITIHLPIKQWYINGSSNNLNYWGLDYPPLTAYHSWILGKISECFDPSWVALTASRGIEKPEHKLFMRVSVMLTMLFLYAPAIILLIRKNDETKSVHIKIASIIAVLCYPGLIFVDNGHFQYNHIALGIFLWSILCFESRRYYAGSMLFMLALNFKQMELYHALPVFVFLLSRSISQKGSIWTRINTSFSNLCKLAVVVLIVFSLLWAPFLFSMNSNGIWLDFELMTKVLRRIFPLYRGVFEDKVANFWCCTSVIFKVKNYYSNETLAMFRHPSERNFRMCLVISSLSFYLFSFQVHEKSILMAAIPALLCLNDLPRTVPWFLSISLFSMYPLCIKDGMAEILPLFLTYHLFTCSNVFGKNAGENKLVSAFRILNLVVAVSLCALLLFAQPPDRYPHLFELFNVLFSFGHFCAFWLLANIRLVQWNCFRIVPTKLKFLDFVVIFVNVFIKDVKKAISCW
uniref:Alpha-1,3-glucosyltransferase n=1 Tax=Ditylenchus dipsaci TaxID=166011 RepID=A0A915DVF3_9BILA